MHHGDHRWRGQTDHLLEASELSCTSFSCTCALTLLQTRLLIERKHPIAELCGKFPFVLFEICISSTLVCDVYSKICLIFRLLGCYQYKITLKCKRCPPPSLQACQVARSCQVGLSVHQTVQSRKTDRTQKQQIWLQSLNFLLPLASKT